MKTVKRLIPIVLSLVFVISAFMTVSALAATPNTAEQDGIAATLTCDKTEYSADEKVSFTLNVKNNNPYAVEGIETEIILPDGFKIESGELKQTAFTLNAEESKDGSVNLAKIPEKPVTSNSPQTGDNSLVGLYAVIMLLSGGALVVIGIKEKWFRKKGVMSLILCFAMVGTVLAPLAVNAASTSKNFSVENTIKYGGKNVTIKANISYLYEKHNKVTFNGTDTYYAVGDTVEITAPEPEEGKHFDHWTAVKGDVTFADPSKSSTTFVMPDGEVELKANYAPNTYTITVTSNDNGAISPAGEVNVEYNQNQTFTITPNIGYHIVDVEIDGVSKGAITSYTFENVKETHTIKATFAIDTFTITATAGANGTITETATVNYGDSKTFTITPNTGYHILDVEVDGVSKGAITSYTFENVKETHTIKATFAIDTFTITATAGANGTITETATVNYGDSKTFTITPNTGYHILNVEVDGVSKGAITSYTFENVKETHTIKATFAIDTFAITATAGANGTITETATVNYGDSKTFTITPNTHYHIADVEVDGVSKGAITSYTFENVKETHTIKATFAINPYTITATAGANGTITESARLNAGDSKTFTMTAITGYGVKDVKVDGTSVGPVTSYTFENVNENHTIEVEFDTATTVTTAEEFRVAVKQDGIIILANDITLDDNGDVEISKNVIIHGNGYKIHLATHSGNGWTRHIYVRLLDGAFVKSENCDFTGNGFIVVNDNTELEVYSGELTNLTVTGKLRLYSTTIQNNIVFRENAEIVLFDVIVRSGAEPSFFTSCSFLPETGHEVKDVCSIRGVTYYDDPTIYLDTDKYKVTKTKDADNVDIWVVTEK